MRSLSALRRESTKGGDKEEADDDAACLAVYRQVLDEEIKKGLPEASLRVYVLEQATKETRAAQEFQAKKKVRTPPPNEQSGLVDRRGIFGIGGKGKTVVKDPELDNNPMRGKLLAMIGVNSILAFIFFQELIYNKIENLGGSFYDPSNSMIGPSSETMLALGALNANFMRNRDESIRMFWSMYMHTGWYHIGMNVMAQLQYMYMYEPDWGFWRTFLVFWVGGISGNITSASVNPCGTTVGSSGGLFGLIGANIVYLFEYWQTVPRPLILVVFTLVIALVSILMGLSGSTDNWAHLGGFIGGFLFAGGTVTVLSVLETKQAHLRRKMRHTEGILQRKNERRMKPLWKKVITKIRDETFASYECGLTVWIFRGVCWGLLILGQILGFLGVFYVPWRASKYFGAMTWSGDSHCCCCDVLYNNTSIFGGILPNNFAVKEGIEVWYLCLGCDYTFTGETWEEACAGNYGYPPKSPAMSANLLTLQSRPKGMHREHPEDGYPIPIKPGAYYYPRPKFAT